MHTHNHAAYPPPINKSLINSGLILLLCLLGGCADDLHFFGGNISGEYDVQIDYEVDGTLQETRSIAATEQECVLSDVAMLFFDNDSDEANSNYITYTIPTLQNNQLSFNIPSGITENKDYRILFIGNLADNLENGETIETRLGAIKTTESYTSVVQNFWIKQSGRIISPHHLPMWGEFIDKNDKNVLFKYQKNEQNGQITLPSGKVRFWRAVSRIDILNLVPDKLMLQCVAVWNYRSQGYVFQDGVVFGGVGSETNRNSNIVKPRQSTSVMSAEDALNTGYTRMEPTLIDNQQKLKATLYAFPNSTTFSYQNDEVTTCLLLGGIVNPNEQGTEKAPTKWYRFNLTNLEDAQSFKRNHVYRAVITGVKNEGKDSDWDAYNEKTPGLDYQVDDEWEDDGENSIVDAYGNYIILSRIRISFAGNNGLTGEVSQDLLDKGYLNKETVTETIKVRTNLTDNDWEIVQLIGDEYIPISNAACQKVFEVKKVEESLYITPQSINTEDYIKTEHYAVRSKRNPQLRVRFYLDQNSIYEDAVSLTANGVPSFYTHRVHRDGETFAIRMRTGNAAAYWSVDDGQVQRFMAAWQDDYIKAIAVGGGDNSDLMIEVPSNIQSFSSEDEARQWKEQYPEFDYAWGTDENGNATLLYRSYELKVKCETSTHQGENAHTMTVKLIQYRTSNVIKIITAIPRGNDGYYHIDAFGYDHRRHGPKTQMALNGGSIDLEFKVSVNNPAYDKFTIHSTFDRYRDLIISEDITQKTLSYSATGSNQKTIIFSKLGNTFKSAIHEDTSADKTGAYYPYISSTNANLLGGGVLWNKEYDVEKILTENQSEFSFYALPFIMGPNDPTIKGGIQIKASSTLKPKLPEHTYTLHVALDTPEVIIDDVLLDMGDGKWLLFSDRYVGHPSRVIGNNEKNEALNFNFSTLVDIPGITDQDKEASLNWNLTEDFKARLTDDTYPIYKNKWKESQMDQNSYYSPFYTERWIDRWRPPVFDLAVQNTSSEIAKIFYCILNSNTNIISTGKLCFSKWRTYLMSDKKTKDGKIVCCWLQQIQSKNPISGNNANLHPHTGIYAYIGCRNKDDTYVDTSIRMQMMHTEWAQYNNTVTGQLIRFCLPLTEEQANAYIEAGYPRESGNPHLGNLPDILMAPADPVDDAPSGAKRRNIKRK